MKFSQALALVIVAILAGAAGSYLTRPLPITPQATAQIGQTASLGPVYERVMKTGTLRCGYLVWAPLFVKDPNTGQYSGVIYDIVEEMGKRLGLKIEWTEEVGTATMFEGYKAGRYDAICAIITPTPERARSSDFTMPYVYAPYTLYVRKDDTRFDNHPEAANDPSVKVVALDGEYSAKIAAEDLPKAQIISLQNMTQPSEMMLYLESGKADVAPLDTVSSADYIAAHGPTIRAIAGPPLRLLPIVIPIPKGEIELKQMLDVTLAEMVNTGYMQKTIAKAVKPGTYLFPATVAPAQ